MKKEKKQKMKEKKVIIAEPIPLLTRLEFMQKEILDSVNELITVRSPNFCDQCGQPIKRKEVN